MWVPESPGDNEASLRREALGHAIFYVGFFAVVSIFVFKIGLRKGLMTSDPVRRRVGRGRIRLETRESCTCCDRLKSSLSQLVGDGLELFECGLQIVGDFLSEDVGVGQII
jgi:hypothetical protein